ncbi:hypothetical protein GBF38_015516 [Nibea albiflora]|uniref:Uncharacterized protein n=1 Tax=Nibea albiflora TaxID=240163 RepID=A0ACB7EMN9_NIBAL|nr:hypothetical protein GBF38_015516 [Nibea albiflora]
MVWCCYPKPTPNAPTAPELQCFHPPEKTQLHSKGLLMMMMMGNPGKNMTVYDVQHQVLWQHNPTTAGFRNKTYCPRRDSTNLTKLSSASRFHSTPEAQDEVFSLEVLWPFLMTGPRNVQRRALDSEQREVVRCERLHPQSKLSGFGVVQGDSLSPLGCIHASKPGSLYNRTMSSYSNLACSLTCS